MGVSRATWPVSMVSTALVDSMASTDSTESRATWLVLMALMVSPVSTAFKDSRESSLTVVTDMASMASSTARDNPTVVATPLTAERVTETPTALMELATVDHTAVLTTRDTAVTDTDMESSTDPSNLQVMDKRSGERPRSPHSCIQNKKW